ncbi:MAG TPA: TetR/AcrR family transcriptional regulator [Candidatus Angelobacter sp.]|jgi:AcrR family transcriptional regulator|nr:TetR/AcrR family transcriptional regulator [Candidatus Angelobacter sp.]
MSLRLSAQDRRQQIMTIAVGLFARKGYQGTTTREIAEEAGVNEALLFRHFPSKENLYWTIIEEQCSARGRRRRINQILKSGGDDFQIFSSMAHEFLVRTPHDTKLTRLLWFTALENHTLSERFFRTYVADYYEALGSHIRERIRRGKFRKVDPLLAARGFFGMVVYHFLIQELFGGEKYQKFDPEHVSATLAGIWLAGMQSPVAALHANGSNGNHARAFPPQAGRFRKTTSKKMMLAKK